MIREYIVPLEGDISKFEMVYGTNGEIIRCKNCKHRPTGDATRHELEFLDWKCPCRCEDNWYSWMPDDDWFCANGETE